MPTFKEVMTDPEFIRKVELLMNSKHRYYPVFSGKTDEGNKIVLYIDIADNSLHIVRPDGEFWALSPHAMVEEYWDMDRQMHHIRVAAPEWNGTAKGSKFDILEESPR